MYTLFSPFFILLQINITKVQIKRRRSLKSSSSLSLSLSLYIYIYIAETRVYTSSEKMKIRLLPRQLRFFFSLFHFNEQTRTLIPPNTSRLSPFVSFEREEDFVRCWNGVLILEREPSVVSCKVSIEEDQSQYVF